MRISDWSSDVCSSDLGVHVLACRNSAAVRFLSQAGGVQRGRGGGVVPAGGARGGGLGDRRLLLYPDRQDDVFRRSRARLRGERQRARSRAARRALTCQIGTASFRARSFPFVYFSLVPLSFIIITIF